jgi:hypothetical protein
VIETAPWYHLGNYYPDAVIDGASDEALTPMSHGQWLLFTGICGFVVVASALIVAIIG